MAGHDIGNSRTFRLQTWIRNLAIVGLCFTGAMMVLFMIAAVTESRQEILIPFIGFTMFFLLYGYLLVTYLRGWLKLADGYIAQRGAFSSARLNFDELDSVRWIVGGRGSIKLQARTAKTTIYLANYGSEARLKIICMLRQKTSINIQDGWPLFCHMVALPQRELEANREFEISRDLGESEIIITRRRYDLWFLWSLPIIGVLVVALAWFGYRSSDSRVISSTFALPIAWIGLWLLLRYSTPKKGEIGRKLSMNWSSEDSPLHCLVFGGLGLVGVFVIEMLDLQDGQYRVLMISWTVITLGGMMYYSYKKGCKGRELRIAEAAHSAARWEYEEKTNGVDAEL